MTVKELRDILKDFDDDVDVMTKKPEILEIVSVKQEQNKLASTIEDDIGKELKLLRKSRRITQEEMGIYLAKQMGKDKPIIKTQIYSYECGKNRITFPIFICWCKVCDANPVEVFNRVVGNTDK